MVLGGWHCPREHVLDTRGDVARMGEDAAGTEWAEACVPGGRPGDLVRPKAVLLLIS